MALLHIDLIEGRKPTDPVVSITENDDADWSFGHGRAQFSTKGLA